MQVFADAARAQLVSITSNSMVVSSGARFPVANRGTAEDLPGNTWFKVVLAYGDAYEVCYVRTHSGTGAFSNVLRGQDGTAVQTWPVNQQQTTVFQAPVASDMTAFLATITALRDRSTHTGEQAISTVTGLQAALDAKETPAGALAQMQAFGLGATGLAAVESSLDSFNVGGVRLFSAAQSQLAGLPLNVVHSVEYVPGGSANGKQYAWPITSSVPNRNRVWHRQKFLDGWTAWQDIANTDSPVFTGTPTAPNIKLGNVLSNDANSLDYYEEGTFTPAVSGATTAGTATYSAAAGLYTRIGNRVSYTIRVHFSNLTGASGGLRVLGLPFTVRGTTGNQAGASIAYAAPVAANLTLSALLDSGSNVIVIFARNASEVSATSLESSGVTSMNLHLTGHYAVA